MPMCFFLLRRPHVFYYKKLVQKPSRKKSQEKTQAKKKAGPEAPENSYKKPIQNSKQQRGRLKAPAQKVVMKFEFVLLKEFLELLAQFFFRPGFFLIFFLTLFDKFFATKKWLGPTLSCWGKNFSRKNDL